MKKLLVALLFVLTWVLLLLVFISSDSGSNINSETNIFIYQNENNVKRVASSTALAIIFRKDGIFNCTAVAYRRVNNLYYFEIPAHCVSETDDINQEIIMNTNFVLLKISDDINSPEAATDVYVANVFAVGYKTALDDYAILTATIENRDIPMIRFTDFAPEVNQCVFNVSFPREGDGNVFFGYITSTIRDDESGSLLAMTLKLFGVNQAPGASGSAVASCASGNVYGIITAADDNIHKIIALSSSGFLNFERKILNNEYPYKIKKIVEDICLIDENEQ